MLSKKLTYPKRIIGIDPGLRTTGFGIIDISRQKKLSYAASGIIRTSSVDDMPSRLGIIYDGIATLIRKYLPNQGAIEKVFVNVNPKSTLLLGQARGAAICSLVSSGLPVAEYSALQLKKAVSGYGHATKEQIQKMIVRLLDLSELPTSDAADALGIAICYAHGIETSLTISIQKDL
ncbi:MAG: crossover junction endodeoxyribonuclease RuvC [Burkholderia sp.]|nr:crossover junction endodeoxyribonuclease RuvC [Burkholderia sp.]